MSNQGPDVLGTAKAREQTNAELDKRHKELLRDYKLVYRTPEGQRVVHDLLDKCYVFRTTFTGNSQGMMLEGKRQMGLYLLHMLNLDSVEGVKIIARTEKKVREGEIEEP
jgi:hypothetical protein